MFIPAIAAVHRPTSLLANLLSLCGELRNVIYNYWLLDNPRYIHHASSSHPPFANGYGPSLVPNTTFLKAMVRRRKGILAIKPLNYELLPLHTTDMATNVCRVASFRSQWGGFERFGFDVHIFVSNGFFGSKHVWLCFDDQVGVERPQYHPSRGRCLSYDHAIELLELNLNQLQDLVTFEVEWNVVAEEKPETHGPASLWGIICCKGCEPAVDTGPFRTQQLVRAKQQVTCLHMPRRTIKKYGYIVG